MKLLHDGRGFDGFTEGKLNCNLGIKATKELF